MGSWEGQLEGVLQESQVVARMSGPTMALEELDSGLAAAAPGPIPPWDGDEVMVIGWLALAAANRDLRVIVD